jgi:elongation factor Ts
MISASLVKELRDKTGAGMMDCKKALEETNGDIATAVDWLREKGIAKAAKKADRVAAEGLTRVVVDQNTAALIEINSETDFVAKNEQFLALLDGVSALIAKEAPKTLEEALALNYNGENVESAIITATATIGEKISFRRFEIVEKEEQQHFGLYMHNGGRISAVAVVEGGNVDVAKNMAMQVASMTPSYVSRDHMPAEIVNKERDIQHEIVKNDETLSSKPEKVLAGIVEGRLSKSLQDMCLVDQIYFKDQDQKVGQYLKQENANVIKFVRYEVGEGIEKKEDNFVEEVMNQAFGK